MKKPKIKRKLVIPILILLIVGIVFVIRKANGHILVEKVDIESTDVRRTVSASGTVVSLNEADVSFATTGKVEAVNINKGDMVYTGDLLSYMANYDSTQSAQAYKDARDVAQNDIDIYVENYSTNLQAVGGEDEYNLNLRRLRELLSRAEANYQASLGTLSKSYLYSPMDGTVVDIYKEVGEVAAVGEKVVKVADLDNLFFEISVDQEDFGLVKVGMPVEMMLDSHEDNLFVGSVLELPQYADEATGEFIIKIALEKSEEHPILLGMTGDADIITSEVKDENALTFDVIYFEDDKTYVWVEENGLARKEYIDIGLEGDVYTIVKTDLSGKNIIVPSEDDELTDGAKVKFKE